MPISIFCGISVAKPDSLVPYVNTYVGTQGWLFHGRTTPYVAAPFGNTHWTACTRNSKLAVVNYHYSDHHIRGFRATHKPAMWMGDYGYFTLKAECEDAGLKPFHLPQRFKRSDEVSRPDYYAVKTRTAGGKTILSEFTATPTCGVFRFTFEEDVSPTVYVEVSQPSGQLGHAVWDSVHNSLRVWNADRQSAHLGPPLPNFKGLALFRFLEEKPTEVVFIADEQKEVRSEATADNLVVGLRFRKGVKNVQVAIGTSFIDDEQAAANLESEIGDASFESVRNQLTSQWENALGRIRVEEVSLKKKRIFYTALWHCLLFPRMFSEQGRYYSAFDDTVHLGESYNDYSLWDTYRAQHPLLLLVAPERVSGMVNSLIQMYEEGGYMPKWPNPTYTNIMIGTHADAVLADALVKGTQGIDVQRALRACLKNAMSPPLNDSIRRWADRELWQGYEARAGLYWYKKVGYVPVDKTAESVSNTLEGAYDDFCTAVVAQLAGNDSLYRYLFERSRNYKNLFNTSSEFFGPRNANGEFIKNQRAGFTEGGPWTYRFGVQHDVEGLIEMMGGKPDFVKKLRRNFIPLRYWHENEPGHHYSYLFAYAEADWLTQKMVARYRKRKYHDSPHGLTGDDDCGQMSAWYVFSSLGFYPVCPGKPEYVLGTPYFEKAELYLNGTSSPPFIIRAEGFDKHKKYVSKVYLNGKPINTSFLQHFDIQPGSELRFIMSRRPVKHR